MARTKTHHAHNLEISLLKSTHLRLVNPDALQFLLSLPRHAGGCRWLPVAGGKPFDNETGWEQEYKHEKMTHSSAFTRRHVLLFTPLELQMEKRRKKCDD